MTAAATRSGVVLLMRMLDMPAAVPNRSDTLLNSDWLAGRISVTGLVRPVPEIVFPFESKASIVSFDGWAAGFDTSIWFCRDGFAPVQYRIFLGTSEVAGPIK